jgi:hypothetical protein
MKIKKPKTVPNMPTPASLRASSAPCRRLADAVDLRIDMRCGVLECGAESYPHRNSQERHYQHGDRRGDDALASFVSATAKSPAISSAPVH